MAKKKNELRLATLSEWLKFKNDFNEATKLIKDIEVDRNNDKASSGNKKVINNLNRLITDIIIRLKKKVPLKD